MFGPVRSIAQGKAVSAQCRTTVVAASVLVVCFTTSTLLLRQISRIRPGTATEDALYISSPKVIRRASLGFTGLMACIYWTRTVQYFGVRHRVHESSYNQLAPLLEITTTLDPQLFPAYQFGANFLAPKPPDGAGEPERAIRLMKFGIEHNPDNWQFYYNLGFIYYTELKDYKKAAEVFYEGSRVPNAHPFMKVMAAQMAEHGGDYTTARMLWSATYETAREDNIRQNALEHLRAIQVDEDVSKLQTAVTRFGQRTGRLPASMADLTTAEHLPPSPQDPDGNPYILTPEGRVLLAKPDDFPFATNGLPPEYKREGLPKFHTKT